jgi:hypothetical protein
MSPVRHLDREISKDNESSIEKREFDFSIAHKYTQYRLYYQI